MGVSYLKKRKVKKESSAHQSKHLYAVMERQREPHSQSTNQSLVASSVHRGIVRYQYYLEQHPVLTKALTSGFLAALGDVSSQLTILRLGKSGQAHYKWRSTAAFAGFSMVVTGPVTHYLYQFLEAVVPRKSNFSSLRKVILERLLFAPPYLLALFYTVARIEGKSHSEAWTFIKSFFLSALLKNWVVWGIAQFINMRYVPIRYRVLFANMISLMWNCYIALIRT